MEYILENEYLRVTVTTWGAQVRSVVRKCDGVEHIWQGDKAVWGYHAPILFPHCGRVAEDVIEVGGQRFPSGQHGFARLMEHDLVEADSRYVVLELVSSPETRAKFPFDFRLVSTFTLEGDTLHHTLTVENPGAEALSFSVGYHPAFTVPFDGEHTYEDYELRFSAPESPLCLNHQPGGLLQGDVFALPVNTRVLPLTDTLFDHDSLCMVNLRSETLGLYEKGSGRGVVCRIAEFPYTLLWSKPGTPKFVCIEPWHGLPSFRDGSPRWEDKAHAAVLAPGEVWETTLSTRFAR